MTGSKSARFSLGSLLKLTFLFGLAFGFLRIAYEIDSRNGDAAFAFIFTFYGINLLIAIIGGTIGGLISGQNGVGSGTMISIGTVWVVALILVAVVVGA